MSVIVASVPDGRRSDVLWARHAVTASDEKIIMHDEIMRLLNEFNNPKGVTLNMTRDSFDEEVLVACYDIDSVIEYKVMDGEQGR